MYKEILWLTGLKVGICTFVAYTDSTELERAALSIKPAHEPLDPPWIEFTRGPAS